MAVDLVGCCTSKNLRPKLSRPTSTVEARAGATGDHPLWRPLARMTDCKLPGPTSTATRRRE